MKPLLPVACEDVERPPADDETDVRWLARRILPEHAGLCALPAPSHVSVELGRSPAVRDYLVRWARNPEAGGAFESATRELRELPDELLLRALHALSYDGLLYLNESGIVGHAFYQEHGDARHAFSVGVDTALEGRGYSLVMLLDYLAVAARTPGVTKARIGRGRNNVARRVLDSLQPHADAIGWRVQMDGWVFFPAQ